MHDNVRRQILFLAVFIAAEITVEPCVALLIDMSFNVLANRRDFQNFRAERTKFIARRDLLVFLL